MFGKLGKTATKLRRGQLGRSTRLEFLRAISLGDLKTVGDLLATYPELARSTYLQKDTPQGGVPGFPALVYATMLNHPAIVGRILENLNRTQQTRQAINERDPRSGNTALIEASGNGFTLIVSELLRYGADINAENKSHITPLMMATARGHADTVRLLLKAGASLENSRKHHVLRILNISPRIVNMIKTFEDPLSVVRFEYPNSRQIIQQAVHDLKQFYPDEINILNKQFPDGDTLLTSAGKRGVLVAVQKLLDLGADPKIPNRRGQTIQTILLNKFSESERGDQLFKKIMATIAQKKRPRLQPGRRPSQGGSRPSQGGGRPPSQGRRSSGPSQYTERYGHVPHTWQQVQLLLPPRIRRSARRDLPRVNHTNFYTEPDHGETV